MGRSIEINYADIASFEQSKNAVRSTNAARTFSLALTAVFFVVLLFGIVVGVFLYRSVSDAQIRTDDVHMQAGLLANTVHMNDNAGAISRGQGPEGPALVMSETVGGAEYETRLYGYQGSIVQEYAIAGRPYDPSNANVLLESATFSFELDGSLLTLQTDGGALNVFIRSDRRPVPESGEGAVGESSADGGSSGQETIP